MKYILPILFLFFVDITSAFGSSNLEVSSNSNFSTFNTDFRQGQTIFVRMDSDLPSTANSKLNLRDNQYSIVNSFQFNKEGNYFSAVIPTPYKQGYYSLEGVIESEDANSTSVKTIKVGNPKNADIKVDVKVSEDGSEVLGDSEDLDEEKIPELESNNVDDDIEFYKNEGNETSEEENKGFGQFMVSILGEIFSFIWPFKSS